MQQETKKLIQNDVLRFKTFQTVPKFPVDAPPLTVRAIFPPKPHNSTKNGQKTLLNTRTKFSTNEQRTTFRLAMNTHLTFTVQPQNKRSDTLAV